MKISQYTKRASSRIMPEELARNYFFSNPYGLDFGSWAGMQDTPEDADIPTEPMPEAEGEEPLYDSETEAGYMPNSPDTLDVGSEPTVSPESRPVPVPKGKVIKQGSVLLDFAARVELHKRGLLKQSASSEHPLRRKVELYLQGKQAADDRPLHKYDKEDLTRRTSLGMRLGLGGVGAAGGYFNPFTRSLLGRLAAAGVGGAAMAAVAGPIAESAAKRLPDKLPKSDTYGSDEEAIGTGLGAAIGAFPTFAGLYREEVPVLARTLRPLAYLLPATFAGREIGKAFANEKKANGDEAGLPVDRKKVEEFLRTHKNLEDSDFHAFAERQGYNTHAAEEVAYQIAQQKLSADLIPGGKAEGMKDSDFSSKQIAMGAKIEKEHTPDPAKAHEIARDHLEEFPNYYSALKEMEKRLESQKEAGLKYALNPQTVRRVLDSSMRKGPLEKNLTNILKRPRAHNIDRTLQGLAKDSPQPKTTLEMLKKFKADDVDHWNLTEKIKKLQGEAEEDMYKKMQSAPPSGWHTRGVLGGLGLLGLGGGAMYAMGRNKSASMYERGRKYAAAKFGLDAAELLGQDEQRKDDLHQQTVRHNEENHEIELQKGQLELQQAQETFAMKQQQQAQKNQEQQAQQQMMQQMQQQQQQAQSQQYMANMAGGGGQPASGVQQQPQQGMQGPR